MKTVYIDCSPLGWTLIERQGWRDAIPDLTVHRGDPSADELARLVSDADIVLNGHTPMDATLLAACPCLKTIVFLGTGASSYVDLEAATARGIEVRTIKGYGDRTNAEHAFALILAASRNVASMDRTMRQGGWRTETGMELAGKRLGVIGVGGVGSQLIRLAHGFGMEVAAWNRSPIATDLPCRSMALDDLLSSSDVVSLHLALNEHTRGMLGKAELSRLKQGAIFVNVARGALVDEAALIQALKTGHIRHAGLDVFVDEPLPADHPLRGLSNVTLTAHAAFSSEESMSRLLKEGFDMARESAAGR